MDIDPKLLEILVCPLTKGQLIYDRERQELISKKAGLAYPIREVWDAITSPERLADWWLPFAAD